MDVDGKLARLEAERKPWLQGGAWVSALYVGGLLGYAYAKGFAAFVSLPPNEVGDFLAGAFAPFAFFWLFIGTRLQAIELKQNSESLMQQATSLSLQVKETRNMAEHTAKQVDAAIKSQAFSRINTVNQTRELYLDDLSNAAYNAYRALCRSSGATHLDKFEKGDREIFARRLLGNAQSERRQSIISTIRESRERKNAAANYVGLYSMFIDTLRQLTDDGAFEEFYRQHPFGELYAELNLLLSEAAVGDEEEVG